MGEIDVEAQPSPTVIAPPRGTANDCPSEAVSVDHISLSYPDRQGGELEVVSDVSFTIGQGEMVALVGPSGCGKSSILSALAGLVPIAAGRVALRGELGIVFQDASLFPWRTVAANVGLGLEIRAVAREERIRRCRTVLDTVGLAGFADHYPHELSGGMQQRVNLARALVMDPDVLLFDEPFAALDAQTREDMQAELLRLWSGSAKAGLFVTHQIDEAVFLADRVVVLSKGPRSEILDEVTITLPVGRDLDVKLTPEFQALVGRIWRHIRRNPHKGTTER